MSSEVLISGVQYVSPRRYNCMAVWYLCHLCLHVFALAGTTLYIACVITLSVQVSSNGEVLGDQSTERETVPISPRASGMHVSSSPC